MATSQVTSGGRKCRRERRKPCCGVVQGTERCRLQPGEEINSTASFRAAYLKLRPTRVQIASCIGETQHERAWIVLKKDIAGEEAQAAPGMDAPAGARAFVCRSGIGANTEVELSIDRQTSPQEDGIECDTEAEHMQATRWQDTLRSTTRQAEGELARAIAYINDKVVPEVRRGASSGLRLAASQCERMAEQLEGLGNHASAAGRGTAVTGDR